MSINEMFEDPSLKQFKDKYFGKYRAVVKQIDDPEKLGRVKVECAVIYGKDLSPWAWPCFQYGGSDEVGEFFPPELDTGVWLEFEQGFATNPIWSGCWWTKYKNKNELPIEAVSNYGKTKIIKTKAGHKIEFNDKSGNEEIKITEGKSGITLILKNGIVTISGNFTIGTGAYSVARVGDSVSVEVTGIGTCEGIITTGSSVTKTD